MGSNGKTYGKIRLKWMIRLPPGKLQISEVDGKSIRHPTSLKDEEFGKHTFDT